MMDDIPENRPNCDEMLDNRNEWSLNELDFDFYRELEILSESYNFQNSYLISLIKSRLTDKKI
jgi:hypothetical protein